MYRISKFSSCRPIIFLLASIFSAGIIAGCSGSSTPRHPGITVDPTSGLTTTEAGGTATFSVDLRVQL